VVAPRLPFLWSPDVWWTESGRPIELEPSEDLPPGGIQLDYLPWRATVFLDGVAVGRVDDFNGYYQHLVAPAGPHQVVIVDDGSRPAVLDVVVAPGRTTTLRGKLQEQPRR
jgi:hypothetical protein